LGAGPAGPDPGQPPRRGSSSSPRPKLPGGRGGRLVCERRPTVTNPLGDTGAVVRDRPGPAAAVVSPELLLDQHDPFDGVPPANQDVVPVDLRGLVDEVAVPDEPPQRLGHGDALPLYEPVQGRLCGWRDVDA